MANIVRGLCKSITESETKSGKKCACVKMIARGLWNEQEYTRENFVCSVYFYDTDNGKDATRALERDFMVGAEIALLADKQEGTRPNFFGRSLPITQGFVRVPAELKPFTEEDENAFNLEFAKCKKYRRVDDNYDIDIKNINDVLGLYEQLYKTADSYLLKLRNATEQLFWPEKFAYIGPVGGVRDVTGGLKRISVCPYHKKDEQVQWSDITFWDAEISQKIEKSGIKAGDIVYLGNLSRRSEYRGKTQYSGRMFERLKKKEER